MPHNHDHSPATKNLKLAFFLNVFFGIFEFFAGLYVNSFAIMANAIHDLGDSFSLRTAWFLEIKSKRKANHTFSYGYAQMSLLGALINSLVIISGSIFVVYGAIMRLIHPEASDANGMIVFAIVGVLINTYAAYKLSGGKSLNEKIVS